MEDGIERMMTPESYNIHFYLKNENKKKKNVEKDLKKIFTFEKDNTIKDIKELKSTNPQ
jgi:hypothetical protein